MLKLISSLDQKKNIVDFHFKGLQGMYFSEYIKANGYVLLFSNLIEDSYYNYIAQINRDVNKVIAEAAPKFIERKRKLAIYITPYSYLYKNEENIPQDFKLWATDSWMILQDLSKITSYKIPNDITIENVMSENKKEYVKTFHIAYSGDDPNDPYANLPNYYSIALKKSFNRNIIGFNTEYVWAKFQNKVVGVASMIYHKKIAGIYGVGTVSKYRKKGIGISMMVYLINKALELNIPLIMLQTEKGSSVEKWYIKMGFKTIFSGKYFAVR